MTDQRKLIKGETYSRREIHEVCGGDMRSYLPHRDGLVVCGCFDRVRNPNAPAVVLVGKGQQREHWAQILTTKQQGEEIPVFIGLGAGAWRFEGDWQAVEYTTDRGRIVKEAGGARADLAGVLYLEPGRSGER